MNPIKNLILSIKIILTNKEFRTIDNIHINAMKNEISKFKSYNSGINRNGIIKKIYGKIGKHRRSNGFLFYKKKRKETIYLLEVFHLLKKNKYKPPYSII